VLESLPDDSVYCFGFGLTPQATIIAWTGLQFDIQPADIDETPLPENRHKPTSCASQSKAHAALQPVLNQIN
jgi:hypothetical protein